ncbi:Tryptophan--tRNA ligase [Neochlamydia sp. TUME1]|uniref:tryptophan--tRNA ligase n=1 Tax=Neochlamydia sp. TUME1 TaxID=1478174 RepID=UPI00057E8ABE|nr:tryptophan--tRNA ligase [Neochlamydia sp. TUME1]KIC71593.1 Tryptophan--tRNA ligase [Neochlamydia sp. TUME1]
MSQSAKKRILTGDRPTGLLHLGHYVGSLKNRVAYQEHYECYLIIADLHMLTTKPTKEDILKMREHLKEMVLDYLACGIDPAKTTIYLQSATPAVYEMNLIFEMMVSLNRLIGLPSLKEMARNAHMDPESVPFGLVGYPVLQTADILMPRAHVVPVGKDNEAHVELARDIARRFNQLYGEVFPMPEASISDVPTLVGIDNKGKMSKSAGNCIFLSDDKKAVEKKVKSMYTDPHRIHAHQPGTVEGNPVFTFHEIFNPDKSEVEDLKKRYREGKVGDVEVKEKLAVALNLFLEPLRERRQHFAEEKGLIEEIIYEGTQKMIEVSNATVKEMRSAMGLMGNWNKISRIARERREKVASQSLYS